MVSGPTITAQLQQLSECFAHFRNTTTVADVLYDELRSVDDTHLVAATRALITTSQRAPSVADIVTQARKLSAEAAARATAPRSDYTEYSQRPERERREIDIARSECFAALRRLEERTRIPAEVARNVHQFEETTDNEEDDQW